MADIKKNNEDKEKIIGKSLGAALGSIGVGMTSSLFLAGAAATGVGLVAAAVGTMWVLSYKNGKLSRFREWFNKATDYQASNVSQQKVTDALIEEGGDVSSVIKQAGVAELKAALNATRGKVEADEALGGNKLVDIFSKDNPWAEIEKLPKGNPYRKKAESIYEVYVHDVLDSLRLNIGLVWDKDGNLVDTAKDNEEKLGEYIKKNGVKNFFATDLKSNSPRKGGYCFPVRTEDAQTLWKEFCAKEVKKTEPAEEIIKFYMGNLPEAGFYRCGKYHKEIEQAYKALDPWLRGSSLTDSLRYGFEEKAREVKGNGDNTKVYKDQTLDTLYTEMRDEIKQMTKKVWNADTSTWTRFNGSDEDFIKGRIEFGSCCYRIVDSNGQEIGLTEAEQKFIKGKNKELAYLNNVLKEAGVDMDEIPDVNRERAANWLNELKSNNFFTKAYTNWLNEGNKEYTSKQVATPDGKWFEIPDYPKILTLNEKDIPAEHKRSVHLIRKLYDMGIPFRKIKELSKEDDLAQDSSELHALFPGKGVVSKKAYNQSIQEIVAEKLKGSLEINDKLPKGLQAAIARGGDLGIIKNVGKALGNTVSHTGNALKNTGIAVGAGALVAISTLPFIHAAGVMVGVGIGVGALFLKRKEYQNDFKNVTESWRNVSYGWTASCAKMKATRAKITGFYNSVKNVMRNT